jgi:hypothetical protein
MKTKANILTTAMLLLVAAGSFGEINLPDDVVRVGDQEIRFGQPNSELVWDPPLLADYYPTVSADGLRSDP